MFTQDITVKQRNGMNECNQVLKQIFSEFIVNQGGVAYASENGSEMSRGFHFSLLKDSMLGEVMAKAPIELREGFTMNTNDVYLAIKDNKKKINKVYLQQNDFGFCTKDEDEFLPLAKMLDERTAFMQKQEEKISSIVKAIQNKDAEYILTDGDVQLLSNNQLLTISVGKFHVRMTKEVVPVINRHASNYQVIFKNIDDAVFHMIMTYNVHNVQFYHQYTVVHF